MGRGNGGGRGRWGGWTASGSSVLGRATVNARVFARGVRLVFVPTPRTAAAVLTVLAATSLLPVLQPWLLKQVVDGISAAGISTAAVLLLAAGYALTLMVPAALAPVQETLTISLEDEAVGLIDREVIAAGERLTDLTRIERPAFHDEEERVRTAAGSVSRFTLLVPRVAGTCMTSVGLLVLVGRLQPLIPLALAVTVIPHLVAQRRMHRLQFQTMADQARPARDMDYCVKLTTQAAGAKEVRTFGLGGWFLARFERRFVEAYSEVRAARLRHLRTSAATSVLHAVALAGGFWYVAAQAADGRLSVGDVALYLNAVIQFESNLFLLSMSAGLLHEMGLHFRHLFAFADQARPGVALADPAKVRMPPARLRDGIELADVCFTYPEGATPVLQHLDAQLPAGKVTALVGANGAGKSTVVKLLTRMYDPTTGEIRLDGARLQAYDLDSLRSRIGTVYQDFARFSLSLGENIAVGAVDTGGIAVGAGGDAPGTPSASDRVRTAAREAGADAVAAKLPAGYDTQLTRRFEGGVELSGGEWQKVATARGFVRDAALVILDEPTAALDADAERRLFDDFRSLMAGRTALLISHRFSTVRMADHILVVEDAGVAEAGSHDELMALGGRYASLFELQAARYR
ncbi:MAG TPA: ABC transporter ATP-binding protein [Actinopolymorphaceae bacterium]|nr:ABC transporter ATP-binding protein [Actinopolymorphaceae bacterium]